MEPRTIPTRPDEAPEPRSAATIVLLREGEGVPEVLMLRRHARSGFAASAWVFPGGVMDPQDAQVPAHRWSGIDPDALTSTFGVDADRVLALHVAAVRETFEEAGVMLATHPDGRPFDTDAPDVVAARVAANERGSTFDWLAFLEDHDLVLDLGAVTLLSRWITPIQEPRRYDTFFFVARLPAGAQASADNVETTESRWVTPQQAFDDDTFFMIFPTIRTLEGVARSRTVADVIAAARAQEAVHPVQPHILMDADGRYTDIVLPDDDRYPHEVYR